ncbi:hypothetical protein MWU60_13035 [Yoonia sp. F2084L]|uniref:imm11 family protein n=1 Tax=Yoonia sp. F2084L TaxID=2926419 RepID=UPI001FF1CA62|nr:DUF1629 domain-containing protein [Yoonia sp. F2084L]MCK0096501.1 hypothetical protein [Yoonia sp. F2084L]
MIADPTRTAESNVKIWRSRIMSEQDAWTPLGYHISKEAQPLFQRGRDLCEPISEEHAPEYLYFEYKDLSTHEKNNLKDIFWIYGGVIIVSQKFKAVLDDFDLGRTQLIPVPIFDYDQTTQLDHKCYIFHIAERKKGFIPELSEGVKPLKGGVIWSPRRDVLAVDAACAEGVDLWRDPLIGRRIFMSDRLVKALKKAKLKIPNIGLAECRVVKR